MRASINRAVDDELRIQIKDVTDFLMGEGRKMARDDISEASATCSAAARFLGPHNRGTLFISRIFLCSIKCQYSLLETNRLNTPPSRTRQDVYRMASRWIVAPDRRFLVTAAHSMREFEKEPSPVSVCACAFVFTGIGPGVRRRFFYQPQSS